MNENPVALMDSVEALDLMAYSLRVLRGQQETLANRTAVVRLNEQVRRHHEALKPVIGTEDIEITKEDYERSSLDEKDRLRQRGEMGMPKKRKALLRRVNSSHRR